MKIKLLLSSLLVLLLSINAEAQKKHKPHNPPTKVVYVDRYETYPMVHHAPPHKRKKVKVRHARTVVVPQRVVYVNRPSVDIRVHKPGGINVGIQVVKF